MQTQNNTNQVKTDEQKIEETRNSWIGKKEYEIYSHSYWGVPDKKVSDGKGGIMVSYSRQSVKVNPYVVGAFYRVYYITTFYINSNQTIYDLKVRMEVP